MSPLIEALIIAGIKYGPEFVSAVVKLMKTETVTIEQVEQLFANVKPYDAYNIPDQAGKGK